MSRFQRPLTMMFGFLGAKPRYVQKYANLVRSLEVDVSGLPIYSDCSNPILTKSDVVEYLPKTTNFFRASAPDQASEEILTIIDKRLQQAAPIEDEADCHVPLTAEFRRRPIIFYLLSNNGAFTFAHFLQFLKYKYPMSYTDIMAQTVGVVWDSSPCYPYPALFTRGFVSVARGILGLPPQPDDDTLTPLFTRVFDAYFNLPSRREMADGITDSLQQSIPPHVAQLFLISEADSLVFASETRAYVAEQRARVAELFARVQQLEASGAAVIESDLRLLKNVLTDRGHAAKFLLRPEQRMTVQRPSVAAGLAGCESEGGRLFLKDFVDSPHVDHLRSYPEEYERVLRSFYEYALRT